tara:strand:- start:29 stop:523 length:495 start_codon:yes stop_codon:yes gene_type:complete
MIIYLENKHSLRVDDFKFRCCIGKKGLSTNKREGDNKTPRGFFKIGNLYFRNRRLSKLDTILKSNKIKKNMGWCNDVKYPKKYNNLIKLPFKGKHEKLYRSDHKYDLLIPILYNFENKVVGQGSCIFLHLTNNYKPTAGCIALKKKDFLIMLKLLNKNNKIKIT